MTQAHSLKTATRESGKWYQTFVLRFTVLSFVGAMAGGIAVMHDQAGAKKVTEQNPPLVVNTRPVKLDDAYRVKERFVGLLEPTRQTRLSFERQGLVTKVLFDEGDNVSGGQTVARLDASRLRSERQNIIARLQEIEARYELANLTLSRYSVLSNKGWQSQQKFDEAQSRVNQLSSMIRGLKASIKTIDIDISKAELKAPYSGTIAARRTDEGTVVNAGTPVIDLMESGVRQARIGISVDASNTIESGQHYQLVSNQQVFQGRLISKRPDLQSGTRTVTALFEVRNADDVPFGEVIELIIERSVKAEGAWLPISSLSEGAKGLWTVFTVVERDTRQFVTREAVEILQVDNGRVYVRGNLSHSSRVITNGTNRIIPGQRVALANQASQ